ncbi:MAG: response regulator [Planctomycetota bacterium]|nr:MAG: response regulator [Planctomycetota bacterium]
MPKKWGDGKLPRRVMELSALPISNERSREMEGNPAFSGPFCREDNQKENSQRDGEKMKPSKQHTILVVDDDIRSLETLAEILSKEGHNIKAFHNALEALEIFPKENFELSILDIHMPEMDGFQVFQRLSELHRIPCIFVTGDQSKEIKLKALDLGAFSVLYKPVSPKLLRYTVQKIFEPGSFSSSSSIPRQEM